MCRQSSKDFEAFFALYSFNINSSPARAISLWLASSDLNTSRNLQTCAFNSLIGAPFPMLCIAETVSHPVIACATSRWADTETASSSLMDCTLFTASRWNYKCRFTNDFSMRITSKSVSFPITTTQRSSYSWDNVMAVLQIRKSASPVAFIDTIHLVLKDVMRYEIKHAVFFFVG